MTRVLITGITGFAGSHLADLLLNLDVEVWGITRWRSPMRNLEHIRDSVKLRHADMHDLSSLLGVVREAEPDYVFHLAAQSYVPTSFLTPSDTLSINAIGTANLLEAIRISKANPVVQIAGSSEEYGLVNPDEVPITEENPLRPMSPYGVSKVAADFLGWQYFQSYGIRVIRTRAFNHTGPRRGEVFAESNFAKQIAMIERGFQSSVVSVGNLEAQRDYTDVRDMVKAYRLAVLKGKAGEVYNLCSEHTIRIGKVLELLVAKYSPRISPYGAIRIQQDPKRMRPSDVPVLLGSCKKFRDCTGWKPEIPFDQTLRDLLDYWRAEVSSSAS